MQKRLFGILATVAIIAAACGGATATSAPPASTEPGASAPAESASAPAASESNLADEQILHMSALDEPPTLDPNKAQDSDSIAVLHGITRGLVGLDHDLNVVDELAASHEVSADAQTLTFHLRDAKYSNGDPIVAGDLVYGWKRLVDPRTAAPYSYVTQEIVGAPDLLAMAGADPAPSDATIDAALDKLGVEAPDDKTFIVHLNTPASYFLAAMTLWVFAPVQEKWINSPNATEAGNFLASGPFQLDKWDHNSEIVLTPNPNWYGDIKPTLTELHMSLRNDQAADQAAYEAGELDMVQTPSPDVPRVKADPVLGAQYLEVPTLSTTYYGYNNYQDPKLKSFKTPGPTANKDFRIALTQSIDKQAFIDATYSGVGQVANSFVMPGLPGYQPDLDPYPFDLASAKDHMAKALAALGKSSAADLGKLSFGFNTGAGHEPRVAFLAEAWRQAFGLQTDQIGSDFSVFLTQRTEGDYALSRNRWGADYPHANNQLTLFVCHGGNNDEQYCNPDYDALIKQAAAEIDPAKQVALYNQAQTILMNDAPFLPLLFVTISYEVQPYVGGIHPTGSDSVAPGDLFYEEYQILKH